MLLGRKSMSKKWWIIVVAIGLIAGAVYAGYTAWGRRQALAQAPAEETAVARRGRLTVTVEGVGSLTPRSEVPLAFLMGGRVADVLVAEGQMVEAGQPLIRLETGELVSQAAQAEARLASAEAQLARLQATPQQEDIAELEANLQAAQAQVSAAMARRDQVTTGPSESDVADARAQVASAEADYRNALMAYDRTAEKDEDRKEQARYDLWAAGVALEAARKQLEELQAGPDEETIRAAQADVWEALKQRDAAQAQLELLLAGPTQEEIAVARAAVDQARVALEQTRLQLKRATLTAPLDGTVVALNVSQGEIASAAQTVVVLSDLSALEVTINVDETDVPRVSVGQKARVTLDAFPDADLTGEVTSIAPVAQIASGVVFYPVTVRLQPTTLPVKAGMTANVEITVTSRENALLVPLRAIHSEGERTYVERLVEGDGWNGQTSRVEQVDVTLGLMTDTQVEVTAGLAEGDVVIVVPRAERKSGPPMPGLFGGGD